MNILLADDEIFALRDLSRVVAKAVPDAKIKMADNYGDIMKIVEEFSVDVAFLDVQMPGHDGLSIAKEIQKRYPMVNIVMVTAYREYALDAMNLFASGYILKPADEEDIIKVMQNLRHPVSVERKGLYVQCFGNFEAFIDGKPIEFQRNRTKEMFAYLIDRKGAMCDADMIIGNIESNAVADETEKSKIRVYSSDIVSTFANLGIHDILTKSKGLYGVNTKLLDCDYYRFLENDSLAIAQYTGEYMTQYEFARETRTFLKEKYRKEH